MQYFTVDNNTYIAYDPETKESVTVNLEKLQQQLVDMQTANEQNQEVMKWKQTLPPDRQVYVPDLPLLDTTQIENQIKELSGV